MTSLSTETAEILKVIRISPQVAAEQTNNAVLSTCQRLVLQSRNYSLPITVFFSHTCVGMRGHFQLSGSPIVQIVLSLSMKVTVMNLRH